MLDPQTYRTGENLAKSRLPTWRLAQTHNLDQFERSGFPVRVSTIAELGQFVDTMQENRFEAYMRELDGLTSEEYGWLLDACLDAVRFQMCYLPSRLPSLPLSTLMSVMVLYRKMRGYSPEFRRVLEIGPGCGYLSFLLRQHAPLQTYAQIEACESFYLFQNLVNLHCFGARFEERVFLRTTPDVVNYFLDAGSVGQDSLQPLNLTKRAEALCIHYPWWLIGELIAEERRFEIVTSNANLLEFTPTALADYLSLVHRVLSPDGIFLVQCMGFPANGSLESLIAQLGQKGFAPLFYVRENRPVRFPDVQSTPSVMDHISGGIGREPILTVNNGLFVKEGHPLYKKYRGPDSYRVDFVAPESLIADVYFKRDPHRQHYIRQQIIEDVERRLSV